MFRLPQAAGARSTGSASTTTASTRFVANVERARYRGILGINIGKNFDTPNERAADDYVACLRAVYAHGALRHRQRLVAEHEGPARPAGRGRARRAARSASKREQAALAQTHGRHVPLAVKIAPDLDRRRACAASRGCSSQHRDATASSRPTRRSRATRVDGPAACRRSRRTVRRAAARALDGGHPRRSREALDGALPIIGVGGILSGEDAREKIDAGAALVQLYTGLIYRGPALVAECVAALESP